MPLECDQIRNEFSALLDNELNPEDRELVEEHLSDCSECLRELHGYKVVSDAYRYHHPVKAPEDFEARFHAAIAPIGRKRGLSWRGWSLAAAAGFTLVAGVAFWYSQSTLKQSATSELALSASAPEALPAADAPPALMLKAPAEGTAPEALIQENAALSVESDAGLNGDVKAKAAPEPGAAGGAFGGGGGFGGGAMAESAPAAAPEAADTALVNTTAPEMARRRASDSVASASVPAKQEQPDLGVAVGEDEVNTLGKSEMRSEATESTAAELADSVAPAAAPAASPAPVGPLRWNNLEFTLAEGAWRQSGYAGESLTKVTIPSPEWNALLDRHTDLNLLCDRDEPVIVKLDDVWYAIAKAPAEESETR